MPTHDGANLRDALSCKDPRADRLCDSCLARADLAIAQSASKGSQWLVISSRYESLPTAPPV